MSPIGNQIKKKVTPMRYVTILILILFWIIGLTVGSTIASFFNLMFVLAAILIFSTFALNTKGAYESVPKK